MCSAHSIKYQKLAQKSPVDERMVVPYTKERLSFAYTLPEEYFTDFYDNESHYDAQKALDRDVKSGSGKQKVGSKENSRAARNSGESSGSESRYSDDSLLSHPSISSVSTVNGDVKYQLRDPGYIAVPTEEVKQTEKRYRRNKRTKTVLETSRVLHRTIAPASSSHNRSVSDSVIVTSAQNEQQSPQEVASPRPKVRTYQKVPIILDSPTLPFPEQATFHDAPSTISESESSSSESVAEADSFPSVSDEPPSAENPQIICGLPCTTTRRKKALLKALDILEGGGSRRSEREEQKTESECSLFSKAKYKLRKRS